MDIFIALQLIHVIEATLRQGTVHYAQTLSYILYSFWTKQISKSYLHLLQLVKTRQLNMKLFVKDSPLISITFFNIMSKSQLIHDDNNIPIMPT